MTDWEDRASFGLKVATDVLFIKNPMGTALGFFVGAVLHGVYGFAQVAFSEIRFLKEVSVNIFYFMSLGIISFNIKPYLERHKVPADIENALNFIRKQEVEGLISRVHAKLEYKALIRKVVDSIDLDMTKVDAKAILKSNPED